MDTSKLDTAMVALAATAKQVEGTEDSAATVIIGISKQISDAVVAAVTAAVAKADATSQSIVDAATSAITDTTSGILAHDGPLGAAIAANNPPAPAV